MPSKVVKITPTASAKGLRDKVVNITSTASVKGLREKLEAEAHRRGLNFRRFVGDILAYAVGNRKLYSGPLKDPRDRDQGGKHIGGLVSETVEKSLTSWAEAKKTSRGAHCRYILEKTLEDGLLDKVFPQTE